MKQSTFSVRAATRGAGPGSQVPGHHRLGSRPASANQRRVLCGALAWGLLGLSTGLSQPPASVREAVRASMEGFAYSNAVQMLAALPVGERDAEAYRQMLVCYTQMGHMSSSQVARVEVAQAALAVAREAATRFPTNAEMVARLSCLEGLAGNKGGSPDPASLRRLVDGCQRALQLDPQTAVAHWALGALQLRIASQPALQRQAMRLLLGGQLPMTKEAARDHLQAAVTRQPQALHFRVWYGRALAACGQTEEARRVWREACALPRRLWSDLLFQQDAAALIKNPDLPLPDLQG